MDIDKDKFESVTLTNPRNGWRMYLITYSKADLTKFPTLHILLNMIKKHFNLGAGKKIKIKYWACSREEHHHWSYLYLKLSHPNCLIQRSG